MMKDSVSPEEKLLRLIRGQKKTDRPVTEVRPSLSGDRSLPVFSSGLRQGLKKIVFFSSISKVTWVAFGVSCLVFIFFLLYPRLALMEVTSSSVREENKPAIGAAIQDAKPFLHYQEGIRDQRIFTGSPAQPADTPLLVNTGVLKDLALVGIISGENPKACIEDKRAQKTYYLTKGQFIGDVQIEDIQEGKIIVNDNGVRSELYL